MHTTTIRHTATETVNYALRQGDKARPLGIINEWRTIVGYRTEESYNGIGKYRVQYGDGSIVVLDKKFVEDWESRQYINHTLAPFPVEYETDVFTTVEHKFQVGDRVSRPHMRTVWEILGVEWRNGPVEWRNGRGEYRVVCAAVPSPNTSFCQVGDEMSFPIAEFDKDRELRFGGALHQDARHRLVEEMSPERKDMILVDVLACLANNVGKPADDCQFRWNNSPVNWASIQPVKNQLRGLQR